MPGNKESEIRNHVLRTLALHKEGKFADSIREAKRVIEKVCTRLLNKNFVKTEEYNSKNNHHVEWNLEKKIRECESRDLLTPALYAELLLIKDWRNDLEHVVSEMKGKAISSISVGVIRRLYLACESKLSLSAIEHWPEYIEVGAGNMLPFSPTNVTAIDGQISIQGANGQRVVFDFENDGAVWIDEHGNKKYYRGNIGERNDNKGWIG